MNPQAHRGADALILADKRCPIDYKQQFFASVEKLEDIVSTAPDGHLAWKFEVYFGHAYAPPGL